MGGSAGRRRRRQPLSRDVGGGHCGLSLVATGQHDGCPATPPRLPDPCSR
ncbi:hypothetical protein I552_1132 [Mycobacterium xenopi 3993]|nr:hypothetical protein I552_1132 [Mycobacterium xenopi 3993]